MNSHPRNGWRKNNTPPEVCRQTRSRPRKPPRPPGIPRYAHTRSRHVPPSRFLGGAGVCAGGVSFGGKLLGGYFFSSSHLGTPIFRPPQSRQISRLPNLSIRNLSPLSLAGDEGHRHPRPQKPRSPGQWGSGKEEPVVTTNNEKWSGTDGRSQKQAGGSRGRKELAGAGRTKEVWARAARSIQSRTAAGMTRQGKAGPGRSKHGEAGADWRSPAGARGKGQATAGRGAQEQRGASGGKREQPGRGSRE